MKVTIKQKEGTLYLTVTTGGKVLYINSGLSVSAAYIRKGKRKQLDPQYEPYLETKKEDILRAIDVLEAEESIVSEQTLTAKLMLSDSTKVPIYIRCMEHASNLATSIGSNLAEKLSRFEAYDGRLITCEEFNRADFERFLRFLTIADKLSESTIEKYVRALRDFMKVVQPDRDLDFIRYKKTDTELIYLEDYEITILKSMQNLPGYMEGIRDAFLLAYYTGIRYQDLAGADFRYDKERCLYVVTSRYTRMCYQPFVPDIQQLLGKNGNVPYTGMDKADIYLKALMRYLEMGKIVKLASGRTVPIYEVATVSLARKSFVMTLLQQGLHYSDILALAGFSDFNTLRPFIRAHEMFIKRSSQELAWEEFA